MADSLEKIYLRYKAAEETQTYKNADSTIVMPKMEDYNNLSPEVKALYPTFASYLAYCKSQANLTKKAMRDKLVELKTSVTSSSLFDSSEKAQYSGEIDTIKSTIVDINGSLK